MVMYRYVTLLWPQANSLAGNLNDAIGKALNLRSPHTWNKAWSTPGMAVYHSGDKQGRMQTYQLANNGGVILGRLFRKDYSSLVENPSAKASQRILSSSGKDIIDNYWGRYVAFLNNKDENKVSILRDPSGAFPCFFTSHNGVQIYFSDMQDLHDLAIMDFTVNWEHLKCTIALPQLQKINTGLNEVGEVLPAERVTITPFEKKKEFLWNPYRVSQENVIDNHEDAVNSLHMTVSNTIRALANCYDNILHNIGGLDSSIALSCMASAAKKPTITCATFFTKSPQGEERSYSRQIAKKFGIPLNEWELDYRNADLNDFLSSNTQVNPPRYCDSGNLTGDRLALAKNINAQALFTGNGGDSVFFQHPVNFGARDYVRSNKLDKGAFKVAMEASRYSSVALATTLRAMLQERFSPPPCGPFIQESIFNKQDLPDFINKDQVYNNDNVKLLHPLLIPNDSDLKGKHLHILGAAFYYLNYYDRWDPTYFAETIHVFQAQPIVELCLRIPVWLLTYGGIDRGLARKAFQNELPEEIIKRRSKSTPSSYFDQLYKHNRKFLRDTLLDGVLVQEKILIRDKLEAALTMNNLSIAAQPLRVFGYLAIESWLRRWVGHSATLKTKQYIV